MGTIQAIFPASMNYLLGQPRTIYSQAELTTDPSRVYSHQDYSMTVTVTDANIVP